MVGKSFRTSTFAWAIWAFVVIGPIGFASAQPASPSPAPQASASAPQPSPDPSASTAPSKAALLKQRGMELQKQGQIDGACAALTESVALERLPSTLSLLAQCHEFQGRTASAYAEHVEASAGFETAGDIDASRLSREAASRLAPRLSRLRIEVTPQPGLVIKQNGVVVAPSDLGISRPTDPGSYLIEASVTGKRPFRQAVRVAGEADLQLVTIGVLEPIEAADKKPPPELVPEKVPPEVEGDGRRGTDALGIGGFVASGFGLVGVVMGTIFGIETLLDVSDAQDDPRLCPDQRCSPAGRRAIDEAESKGIASTVLFSVGGAALASGVIILIVGALDTDEAKPAAPPSVSLAPWLSPDGGGLGLSGQF